MQIPGPMRLVSLAFRRETEKVIYVYIERGREKRLTTLAIDLRRSRPASTQIDISDNALVPEMVPNIAIRAWEIGRGYAP